MRCLAHAGVDVHALDWNPAGERLLVNQNIVLDENGARPSGFEPTTHGVSWSQPLGSALIAPSATGDRLDHINAGSPNDVLDVASLETTWAAGYHPDGKAIVSAGVAADGRLGLFLADNRGEELQQLAFFTGDDPPDSTITFVGVDSSGNEIIFVHDHGSTGTAHLHSLAVSSIDVEKPLTTIELETPPTGVVVSESEPFTFAWVLDQSTRSSAIFTNLGGPEIPIRPEAEARFEIGGWLGQQRLVTLAHSSADPASTGSARLWLSGNGGIGQTLFADGVTAATTRTHHAPFLALDEAIIGQAVG